MKKTRELIVASLRLVGAVVEVCDARIPVSSRNPVLDELTRGKPRVLVLNKSDLADEATTQAWLGSYGGRVRARANDSGSGILFAIAMNSLTGGGLKKLLAALVRIANTQGSDVVGNGETRRTKPLRVMVVGVPNSGKSSLINRLAGRRAAQTGDKPGVTKGKQWLTIENGMQLLDTPGILWPKFDDPNVGLNLAFCGSIKDEIMDAPELALELIRVLEDRYPGMLAARYGLGVSRAREIEGEPDASGALSVMEGIARGRGCVLPGKRVDYERAGRVILDEFRAGKLGRITLEDVSGRNST
jgi:ribosome biogenesis GTPase A